MLTHPSIVAIHDSFVEQDLLNIVLEYADGGDLNAFIQRRAQLQPPDARFLPESNILELFVQIALAIDHCHARKILHRVHSQVFSCIALAIVLSGFENTKRVFDL